jgi:NTP pyrophosphatase (non-canonical NTP hydrolase)
MEIRKEVLIFAEDMEQKLRENDYKGGWKNCEVSFLIGAIEKELGELKEVVKNGEFAKIIREAADVANFAMMIADQVRGKR